jgi:hypothetical protein
MIEEFCNMLNQLEQSYPQSGKASAAEWTEEDRANFDKRNICYALRWCISTGRTSSNTERVLFGLNSVQQRNLVEQIYREGQTTQDGVKYWLAYNLR